MSEVEFEEDQPRNTQIPDAGDMDAFLLDIDGYEGPIDVLLEMARNQKVDLREITILQLVRQYLAFIDRAKELRLELAAEYLVMAAWLAYLKSRLLLPQEKTEGAELSGDQMAEALQFQLRRLEAMRAASEKLMGRPRLGEYTTYELPTFNIMTMEDAADRMAKMLGNLPRTGPHSVWTTLESFIPEGITDPLLVRSSVASTFTAGLEMAKQGKLEIRQEGAFKTPKVAK